MPGYVLHAGATVLCAYGQRFRISREGTGTTVPAVLP